MTDLLAAWPSVGLLVLLGLIWLEYRLLGGRATLSPLRFLLAFSFGMAGAGILAVLFPLIFNGRLPIVSVSYTWGPVMEETVKALPALLLAGLWLRAGRRLSLVDVTLLGLASGLGFQFIETNLRLAPLAAGEVGPNLEQVARELVPWLQGPPQGGMISVSGGHGLETAFIALAAGIGIKLWPRGRLGLLPALVALAWASLDHAYFNWEVASGTQPIGLFQQLDQLTLQGRLQLYVLPIGLVLAAWLEGRRTARLAGSHPELLLPGERAPIRVVAEWLLAWSRLPLGLGQVWRALTYFRHRRAYLLAAAEARSGRADASLAEYLTQQDGALTAERDQVVQAERLRRPQLSGAVAGRLLIGLIPTLLVGLLFLLTLLLGRQLPPGLHALVFGRGLALTFAVLGLLYIGWRWYRFRRQPRPGARAAGEHVLQYDLGALLLGSSTLTSVLALYGWFQPSRVLPAAAAAFVTDALSSSGLNPTTILATIAPVSATAVATNQMEEPERPKQDPCSQQRRAVTDAQTQLDELKRVLGDPLNSPLGESVAERQARRARGEKALQNAQARHAQAVTALADCEKASSQKGDPCKDLRDQLAQAETTVKERKIPRLLMDGIPGDDGPSRPHLVIADEHLRVERLRKQVANCEWFDAQRQAWKTASDYDKQEILRGILERTKTGKGLVDKWAKDRTQVVFGPSGSGSHYSKDRDGNPTRNEIHVDGGATLDEAILSLAHELNHMDYDHDPEKRSDHVERFPNDREGFINGRCREEADGDLTAIAVKRELANDGITVQATKQTEQTYQRAYDDASRKAIDEVVQKSGGLPNPDELEKIDKIANDAGREAVGKQFRRLIGSSSGTSYEYRFGQDWDNYWRARQGAGGQTPGGSGLTDFGD